MDIDQFVADCVAANAGADAQAAVAEVMRRAMENPSAWRDVFGEPEQAGIQVLHRSDDLSILNAVWTPQMNLMPHNHLMWANIGIYAGREDNLFWRQDQDRIRACGAEALFEKDVTSLPVDVIHSVTNPLLRFTGGIHVYGGDFFATERSMWDPESLEEGPSDGDVIREIFERENARFSRQKNADTTH